MINTSDNNKRIARNTFLLYIRMFFTMGVNLYTSRIVLNALGIDDYGIYNVVGGVVSMFGFINSAMASATQRFITFEIGGGSFDKLKKIFSTSLNIHIIISVVIFILAETVGLWFFYTQMKIPAERMSAAFWVYQFSVVTSIVMIISVPYNATIIAHEKMSAFAYISIIEVTLKLLVVYLLVIFDFDKLVLYAFLLFVVQVIIRGIYGAYCKQHFEEAIYQLVWDRKLFKEMSSFAGWQLFGCTAGIAYTQGLNILLNIFFGPAINAARGIAVQVQSAIQNFSLNFQQAMNPQITKSYASNNLERMNFLVNMSSKYSFFLLFLLSLPVLIGTSQVLTWWLKIVPEHTVSFIRIMLVIMMIDATASPLVNAAGATGKIKVYQMVVGGILLLILPISYIVLKLGANPEAVFFVHLLMVICSHIARLWMIRSMIKFSIREYAKNVVAKIAVVISVSIVLPIITYIELDRSFLSFIIMCILSLLSVSIAIYTLGLSRKEREFILSKIKLLYGRFMR